MRTALTVLVLGGALMLGACSSSPPRVNSSHAEAARIAASMEGKPYRYGGHTPEAGFDCAGLVYYSYQRVGMKVPRTTYTQRDKSLRVPLDQLARGDLLFFTQEGKFSSHVGIYLGNNRFIHAPSTGKRLRIDDFKSNYWQKHFVDARRF
jgi:cell wall-associated NlpC family hydrolase